MTHGRPALVRCCRHRGEHLLATPTAAMARHLVVMSESLRPGGLRLYAHRESSYEDH